MYRGGAPYDTGNDILEPLDAMEGQAGWQLIRFRHFVEVLQHYLTERNKIRNLNEWVAFIQELVADLIFESGEEDDEDFNRLIRYLEKLFCWNSKPVHQFRLTFSCTVLLMHWLRKKEVKALPPVALPSVH